MTTSDRDRLAQIRRRLDEPGSVAYNWDVQWLLDRLDALGQAMAKTDPFVGSFDDYCLHCEWIAGEDGIDHASDCIYAWVESVYGEPDEAAGPQETTS